MVNIAVMGYGVVGSGTVEVIYKNKESIAKKCGDEVNVKYILDLRDFEDSPYKEKFTKNFEDIIKDESVLVVAEVMGGLNPAYDYVKRCLLSGKSVVTSNKELVAAHGHELLKIASLQNVNFLFEASVGGGIPIIRPIYQCLAANEINEIVGILNGTTNFILTKMIKDQMRFEDALKLAQELGYAERNPSADIDGHDACRKICILASLAFGKHVYPDSVHTQGITGISLADVDYVSGLGGVIKLIGSVKKHADGTVSIFVSPAVVYHDSQLSTVDGVFNGIMVRGDAIGDVLFYGQGAGKLPTASAVAADIIDCIKHSEKRQNIFWEDAAEGYVRKYEEDEASFFVRAKMPSGPVADRLKNEFSGIRFVTRKNQPADEIAFLTNKIQAGRLDKKLKDLKGLFAESVIRILE